MSFHSCYLLPAFMACQALGLAIDAKIDLPYPSSLVQKSNQPPIVMDSSLSPKIIKAFYEINFVQVAKPDPNRSHITITDSSGCPYSKDFCKFYFAPSKVSVIQKVEDMITESKSADIPVIQGIAVADEEKLLKELSPTIKPHLRQNKASSRKTVEEKDVPVFRGTVNVDSILKTPEVLTLPDYKPRYPEIKRSCFQGTCWSYQT